MELTKQDKKHIEEQVRILTIAHLNHTPEDCSDDNLRALCQKCHNQYDAQHLKETRKGNIAAKQ